MKPHMTFCAVMLSVAVLGTAVAEDAPKDNKGFTTSKTVAVDLGSEIEG